MEDKRIYYVGIDHGNHLMKSANHVFENGVERLATKPTFSGNTLIHEGVFYKIGEKRNSVKDSKLADDDYYLLTLVALAKECQSGAIPNGAKVVLGVGLPLKHFATTRKAFVRYLKREQTVKFNYEDTQYNFTIENVLVFPQCYAAVADKLDRLLTEKHFLNQTELIKHGIELVYSEVYEDEGVQGKVAASGADVQVLAELLVDILKLELQQLLGDFEERIADSMKAVSFGVVETEAVADNALVEVVISTEDESALVEESEKESIAVVHEEKELSVSAISFLKGLNDD